MKVATILINGFEEIEALMPVDMLRRAGIQVDMISLENIDNVLSSHKVLISSDKKINDVNLLDYDAIFLPGGPNTLEYLKYDKLNLVIREFYNKNKYIFAICAAPTVLAINGILENKKATCYHTYSKYLIENSVTYVNDKVVVLDNIITARSVGVALEFSLAIIEKLLGKDKVEEIKKQIMY